MNTSNSSNKAVAIATASDSEYGNDLYVLTERGDIWSPVYCEGKAHWQVIFTGDFPHAELRHVGKGFKVKDLLNCVEESK
jgi:hypothetical protein